MTTRTRNIALAVFALLSYGFAQDNKPPEPKPPSQAEYDLIQSYDKETNPTQKLAVLDKWAKDFPDSDYKDKRQLAYLGTYQQLMRLRDASNMAAEILKTDPNNWQILNIIIGNITGINPPSPADLDLAERTASYIVAHADEIYAPDKKPADKSAAEWAQLKPAVKAYAQKTIGWIYLTRKDYPRAEAELTKTLQLDPTQAAVSQMLGQVILAQNKTNPEKQPLALYQYARAAAYEGPNALDAKTRATLLAFVKKNYPLYHGSDQGMDQMLALAKANALPPADFKVESTAEIAQKKAEEQAKIDQANPMMAFWRTLKENLTGANSDAFWEMNVKGSELPGAAVPGMTRFKGKIVSMTPAIRPKELVLAVEKPDVGDVTLKFDMPLPGKMDAGSELEFEGEAEAFTKDPYMLTLKIDDPKEKLAGWTGTNPRAPAKKAAPKKQ